MVRHGETGLLVPPEAPVAMCRAIVETLNRPERALQMAEQAHNELDRFTWRSVRDAWHAVYRGSNVEVLGSEVGVHGAAYAGPERRTRNRNPGTQNPAAGTV